MQEIQKGAGWSRNIFCSIPNKWELDSAPLGKDIRFMPDILPIGTLPALWSGLQ